MSSKMTQFKLAAVVILLLAGQALHAAVVVASRDSSGKGRADVVCDGTDDQVEIQEAIDALPSSGGAVELLQGTFNFSDDLEITKSNVTIRGAGKSTVLRHNATQWVKLAKTEEKGSTTITVEDISQFHVGQLVGISDDVMCPPQQPDEPFRTYGHYYIFSALHVVKHIRGNTMTLDRALKTSLSKPKNARAAPAWVMVKAYRQTNLELRDFSIDCNRDNIARVYHGYCHYPGYDSPPATILDKVHHGEEPTSAIYMDYAHNSIFKNLYLHEIPMSGIFLVDSNYVLAEGNTIRNYGLKGYVNCFGDFTRILGNVVENSQREDGIVVYDRPASYAVVSNNIVRNCPRHSIDILGAGRVVVSGNQVYGGANGILIYTAEGATVTGNYVEGSARGLYLWAVPEPGTTFDGPITISGNSMRDCMVGVGVNKAYGNVTIVGNAIAEIRDAGMVLSSGAIVSAGDESADGLIISNNQFLNGSSKGPAVRLGGDRNFIFGNKMVGFPKGIWLEPTAEGNVVARNGFTNVPQSICDEGKGNTDGE